MRKVKGKQGENARVKEVVKMKAGCEVNESKKGTNERKIKRGRDKVKEDME